MFIIIVLLLVELQIKKYILYDFITHCLENYMPQIKVNMEARDKCTNTECSSEVFHTHWSTIFLSY